MVIISELGALKLMQANGCLISFQKVSTAAVVSAVERALGTCRGTVYVDLRSVPAPSLSTLDIIGKIYGRVATLAPQRNVVPLLSTAYPQGELKCLYNVDWCYHVDASEGSNPLGVSAYGSSKQKEEGTEHHRESWQLNKPDPHLVVRESAIIPSAGEALLPFTNVALGGTFDRLHAGHRLLLSAAAAVSSQQLFIGVADNKLLEGKRLRGLIQDYDQRVSNVLGFLRDVCPSIDPVIMRLQDPNVPTRAETEHFMNAIVVSQETLKGGVKINNGRVKLGFKELVTIVVPVLGAMSSEGEKLSSTTLREADARKNRSI